MRSAFLLEKRFPKSFPFSGLTHKAVTEEIPLLSLHLVNAICGFSFLGVAVSLEWIFEWVFWLALLLAWHKIVPPLLELENFGNPRYQTSRSKVFWTAAE